MEKGIGEGVQKIKRDIHNKASLGNTRPGQRNASKSRYIRLCNRRSVIDKV